MERGHRDTAPGDGTGTEPGQHPTAPDGPLVFDGSSPANVGFARTFWTSALLPPPLESSLGPATVRQSEKKSEKERLLEAQRTEKMKATEKYLQQAKKREEILALLRKQREERIAKELISHPHRPKIKSDQMSRRKVSEADLVDQEAVKALK
ncbi:cilia- and flagella-associated protein HOATZ [Aegotheles albertisi]